MRIHSGKLVAFERAHDHAASRASSGKSPAVADLDEDEIRRARDESQLERGKFLLEISATFVGHALRFGLMRLVGQARERAGLGEAIDVKRLARFLQHLDQLGRRDAVAEPNAGEPVDLRKSPQHDDVSSLPNELQRVRRIVEIFEISLVENDHDVVGHAPP